MIATSSTTLWYTTRATGIVALVLLTATLVLGILTAGRVRSKSWPAFAQADLHKRISLLAMVFLAFHVLTSVLDTYVNVGWAAILVPFASAYRPVWTGLGTVGVDLILAVAISSALRQRISAQAWRTLHWLAYGSWPVAMAHSLGMGTDASELWLDGLAGACSLAVIGSVTWRIGDYKKGKARAFEVGSLTRAVVERRPAGRMKALSDRSASSGSRRTHPAGRLLEKERS